jgi:lysophospholipase L1-like esterase
MFQLMFHHPRARARTAARSAMLLGALACRAGIVHAQGASAPTLPLYEGKPIAGAQVVFGDADVQRTLPGASAAAPTAMGADPKQPNAAVEARRTARSRYGSLDALALRWKDSWFATLRIDSPPLDLRPYLADGTLSFDLKVDELAGGGLAYRLDCGTGCERKVVDVVAARAAQGRGWRRLSYALRCFWRDGDDVGAVTRPFALDGTGAGEVEVANVRIEAHGQPNTACPDYRTAAVTAAPLEESWSLAWWMPRHEAALAEVRRRRQASETTGIVFIGDSITHNWDNQGKTVWAERYAALHPLNLGFAGDRTENLLWRLQHGEVDGIDPKVAVLLIGTNNGGARQDSAGATVAGIRADIEQLRRRLPHTRILLLAIFPRGPDAADPQRRPNAEVNAQLAGLADGRQIVYLDIGTAFLAADGTLSKDIMPDLLHPDERGYRIWADAMAPTLDAMLH